MHVPEHEMTVCPDCGLPEARVINIGQLCDDPTHGIGTETVTFVPQPQRGAPTEAELDAARWHGAFTGLAAREQELLARVAQLEAALREAVESCADWSNDDVRDHCRSALNA